MKRIVLFVSCIVIILTIQSCYFLPIWESWESIDVENNSEDTILVYLASGKTAANPTVYPDTCLPIDTFIGDIRLPHTNDSLSGYLVSIPPHDGSSIYSGRVSTDYWGHNLRDKFFEEHGISIFSLFFIHADTLKKRGYNQVARNNMILARYDLSESDIRLLDMTIPFPPSETMKEMKIWVPSNSGASSY